ncbi:MAG: NAD-dependent epimerase/dehydratase family protein [Gemmatimonadetes bacterium]|nr:MAG: NAD-dependent epimerase/dehydratase family protein [Gemmatimonadota bacterium]
MDTSPVLLITGFPGFLGSRLLPGLLEDRPDTRAVALVQPSWMEFARARLATLSRNRPELDGRVELVPGDITDPDLGGAVPTAGVREIVHLAAVYDLAVERGLAERVNVRGTEHVLAFAGRCDGLVCLHYMSTCYVSGRYEGVFREQDLDVGQRFNNHYEATKFEAEVAVRRAADEGLPVTVYRPSIVVGERTSGRTDKADGPYRVIRFLLRQPRVALTPLPGDPDRRQVNIVPVDYVEDAVRRISRLPEARGGTYQLADPAPPTIREFLSLLAEATGRRVVPLRLPPGLARWATRFVPGVRRWTGIDEHTLAYFDHPTRYDTARARALLEPAGIRPPAPQELAPVLVEFLRTHPEVADRPMV